MPRKKTTLTLNRWDIICSESKRFYQFWIGLPVQPRRWKFELPDLDREL